MSVSQETFFECLCWPGTYAKCWKYKVNHTWWMHSKQWFSLGRKAETITVSSFECCERVMLGSRNSKLISAGENRKWSVSLQIDNSSQNSKHNRVCWAACLDLTILNPYYLWNVYSCLNESDMRFAFNWGLIVPKLTLTWQVPVILLSQHLSLLISGTKSESHFAHWEIFVFCSFPLKKN